MRTLLFLILVLAGLAPVSARSETSELPRHDLERQALTAPDRVLEALGPLEQAAAARSDQRELALLALARANACRVIADWTCQRNAGAAATAAGAAAGDPILVIRGQIAEARGWIAQKDFSRGERLLGQAQLALEATPHPELAADVDLAFSSLSFSLGKHSLSGDYARQGLEHLGAGEALPMRVRLMRNLARALAQTGEPAEARTVLDEAVEVSHQFVDPKLSAELSLEIARLARQTGDLAGQIEHGNRVLTLSRELTNTQLEGLGREVLGLAALDQRDLAGAERELDTARAAFASLGLSRDEARVSREQLGVMLERGASGAGLARLLRRMMELETEVIESDRAQAADAFEARLEYARRELEVLRLENQAALSAERANALAARIRLGRFVVAFGALLFIVLATFFVLQRRTNRRLRKALADLQQSEARAVDLLRLGTGYLFLYDVDGRLVMLNPAAAAVFGASPENLVGRPLADFMPSEHHEAWGQSLAKVLAAGRHEGTIPVRRGDGEIRWWRYTSRLSPADLAERYVIGQAVDVTEEIARTESLRRASLYDALTHCYNRRYLQEFEHDHLGDHSWGVVYFDLDGFKRINDTLGHERGDQVLTDFGRFLLERVRADDAVVRIGGDEFVILLARAGEGAVRAQVERLQRDAELAPTAFSMGFAVRSDQENLSETLARADSAMYQSRGRGLATDTWDHPSSGN